MSYGRICLNLKRKPKAVQKKKNDGLLFSKYETGYHASLEFTFKTFEFPKVTFDWNSRSTELAATVRIHGATLAAVPGRPELPAEAEVSIPFLNA